MKTEAEIRDIALKLQPKMTRWLQNSLKLYKLDFEDSMRVVVMLLETGADTAAALLKQAERKITVVQ